MRSFLAGFTILFLPSFAFASTWLIDPDNSRVRFKVHPILVSPLEGVFHKMRGVAILNEKDITQSRIKVSVDASSVDTGTAQLDETLRSDSFLDVAHNPTVTFESRKITRNGPNKLKVNGNLKLHGVTREVMLDVKGPSAATKDRHGKMRRTASAVACLSRKAFGLTLNPLLTAGLGDEIDFLFDVEFVKK